MRRGDRFRVARLGKGFLHGVWDSLARTWVLGPIGEAAAAEEAKKLNDTHRGGGFS